MEEEQESEKNDASLTRSGMFYAGVSRPQVALELILSSTASRGLKSRSLIGGKVGGKVEVIAWKRVVGKKAGQTSGKGKGYYQVRRVEVKQGCGTVDRGE